MSSSTVVEPSVTISKVNQSNHIVVELSDHQQAVMDGLLNRAEDKALVTKLGGIAGSGKTTLLKHLVGHLESQGLSVAVAAYAGKAASVLRQKGIDQAQTLHSLIYKPKARIRRQDEIDVTKPTGEVPTFSATSGWTDGIDVLVVDESSMVPREMFNTISRAKIPSIYTGDFAQLPPVRGDGFNLMEEAGLDFKLDECFRHAGPIAHFANFLRTGSKPWTYPHKHCGNELLVTTEVQDSWLAEASITLTWKREDVTKINRHIRRLKSIRDMLAPGEPVMCLQNCSHSSIMDAMTDEPARLFNGQILKIAQIIAEDEFSFEVIAETEEGNLVTFLANKHQFDEPNTIMAEHNVEIDGEVVENPEFYVPLAYAYASTVHKFQGSEALDVIVIDTMPSMLPEFPRWSYTASSRARRQLLYARGLPGKSLIPQV